MIRLLPLLLLIGCTAVEPWKRDVTLVLTEDVQAQCPSFYQVRGCAKMGVSNCTIVAKEPRSFDDKERLLTLGHELWHCFKGRLHL